MEAGNSEQAVVRGAKVSVGVIRYGMSREVGGFAIRSKESKED